MKISFFNIGGNSSIAVKSFFKTLGLDVIIPPKVTNETIKLSERYSSQLFCFPIKIATGNLIEVVKLGAEVLFLPSGKMGRCRVTCYHLLLDKILKELGYNCQILILGEENILRTLFKTLPNFSKRVSYINPFKACLIFWWKIKVIDELEKIARKIRPYALNRYEVDKILEEGLKLIDEAEKIRKIKETRIEIRNKLVNIKKNENNKIVKIGIIGEFYVLCEPFSNFEIEKELANLGVESYFSMTPYEFFKTMFGANSERIKIIKSGINFLKVSAEMDESDIIGQSIKYITSNFDGIIYLYPFTCFYANTVKVLLSKLKNQYDIPTIVFSLDENVNRNNIINKLEIFIDLIKERKWKHT